MPMAARGANAARAAVRRPSAAAARSNPDHVRMTNDIPAAPRARRGELYAALAAIGYGSAYVATAFALRSFAPLPAAVYRSVLGALALIVLSVAIRGRSSAPGPAAGAAPPPGFGLANRGSRLLLLAILGGPVFLAAMNLAVAHVGATITAFVAGLYAVLAAVIAPALLPERLAPRALAGFLVALAGTALLAELDPGSTDLAGMGWGLLAAVSFSLFLVLTRRWSGSYALDGLTVAFAMSVVTAAALGAVVLLIDPASLVPAALHLEAVAAIAWLGIVAAGGQMLMVAGLRLIPASRSAAFLLFNPISATLLAAVLLGERPSPPQMLGGLLVLIGIAAATGAMPIPAWMSRAYRVTRPG